MSILHYVAQMIRNQVYTVVCDVELQFNSLCATERVRR
jgi:hypothetical protein